MIKYEAPQHRTVEIAQIFDKPIPYFLNRPLVMLLEGLGIPYETFKMYQDMAITDTKNATKSIGSTISLLEQNGLGTSLRLPSVLSALAKLGVQSIDEPFYNRMMEFSVHHVLRDIKHKARIPIPGGWNLVGVADIHQYLQPNEISVCVRCPTCNIDVWLEGDTIISRSPTIAPGDIQRVTAIGKPPPGTPYDIEPLRNTVVFSVKGIILSA
jgi:RNA-dependent RNA polymerase